MHHLWVEKRMKDLSSQQLVVQARNMKSKNILSRVEREEVMAFICYELLYGTLQSSTANIGDTPNAEIENNKINIGIVEHGVIQKEEIGVEYEAARVIKAILNAEGTDILRTKVGTRQVNAEEKFVSKRLRDIFETKTHSK